MPTTRQLIVLAELRIRKSEIRKSGTKSGTVSNLTWRRFTYDCRPEPTTVPPSNEITFSAENQITQMDGGAAVYGYDGEGRRMKKTVGSETTYYFYGPGGLLCEFTTTNTGATQAASTLQQTGQRTEHPTSWVPRY